VNAPTPDDHPLHDSDRETTASEAEDSVHTAVADSPSAESADDENGEETDDKHHLSLEVEIEDSGPCRKHIRIRVPRDDISHFYAEEVSELAGSAQVPGFRVGHVPKKLIEKRFRKELADQVKQKVLVQSLEQVAAEYELDPISEPDLDVEAIELPEDGDFEYEFDVEVRPEFELPDYEGLVIEKPTRDITEDDVEAYLQRFLEQYGTREEHAGPAEAGDYVTLSAEFRQDGRTVHKIGEFVAQVRPVLQFQDAEVDGFDELMAGAKPGEARETTITVSTEAEHVELRGEALSCTFKVRGIRRLKMPELSAEFFERIGVEDEEELRDEIRATLHRQVEYQQRQACRRQVLEKITESADWELPEDLVLKQVENALRREVLEMQQAGFTSEQIRSRENEIRQQAVSNTEEALKEHFVLDKIATKENLEVSPQELDVEIQMMAMQRGESPRRVRARLQKSGMDENLSAQIRERKAVDFILQHAQFEEVPMEPPVENRSFAVSHSVCGVTTVEAREDEPEAG